MNLGAPELLIVLVLLGGLGAIIFVATNANSTAGVASVPVYPPAPVVVSGAPDQVAARIVQLLVQNGALVTAHTSSFVTGHVVTKKKPSVLVAILLWFVCVIPMIIYLINSSKDVTEPFSISLAPVPDGTRLEGGGVGRGMAAVHWVLGQLSGSRTPGTEPGWVPTSVGATPLSAPSGAPASGWYPDPHGEPGLRWWDGSAWTDHVHRA